MKTYRKSKGRFQFILDLGRNKKEYKLGIHIMYMDGFNVTKTFFMDGFWNIELSLIFLSFTINVNDRKK